MIGEATVPELPQLWGIYSHAHERTGGDWCLVTVLMTLTQNKSEQKTNKINFTF